MPKLVEIMAMFGWDASSNLLNSELNVERIESWPTSRRVGSKN